MKNIIKDRIIYIYKSPVNNSDGGSVLDNKLCDSLLLNYNQVKCVPLSFTRSFSLPFWSCKIASIDVDYIKSIVKPSDFVILSHESIFSLSSFIPVDLFLIHNYFPAFKSFNFKLNLISLFFKSFSITFFRRYISLNSYVILLSLNDYNSFISHNSHLFFNKVSLVYPGISSFSIPDSSSNSLLLTGSSSWLPKKFPWFSKIDYSKLYQLGVTLTSDCKTRPKFALINELFIVGFKLKLLEMIRFNCIIFSPIDLSAEINKLCPNYNKFHHCRSKSHFFQLLEFYIVNGVSYNNDLSDLPTWNDFSSHIISIVDPKKC